MKSRLQARQASMGYASAAPVCGNCTYAQQRQPSGAYNDHWALRCTKGGFGTTAHAICREHVRAAPALPAQKGGAA